MTPRPPESPATAFAVALLEEFHRLGVRDIVLEESLLEASKARRETFFAMTRLAAE